MTQTHTPAAASQDIVAVTGATGFVGRRTVDLLRETGSRVRTLSRSAADSVGVESVQGDIRDASACRAFLHGARWLVHLAGVAHTDLKTPEERLAARTVNVDATRRLLDEARAAGVQRVLLASSAHVYAGQSGISLREESATAGDSVYAEMKLAGEAAAAEACAAGLDCVVIRPCIVYGPGAKFNLASLMQAVKKGYYFHAGKVNPLRSFASVDTVASAIVHLLQHGSTGQTYNLADEHPVHLAQWVDSLADRLRVTHPRTLPMPLLSALAVLLTPFDRLGLPAPLTTTRLSKLTTAFSLDVSRLASSGFVWPSTNDRVLDEMVRVFEADRAGFADSHTPQGSDS